MREWYFLLHQLEELHTDIQRNVYRNFYELIYRDIYFLLNDHDLTEDLIQEVFFKVISSINKYQIKNPSAWIKQIARNHTKDFLRKNIKERNISQYSDVSTIEQYITEHDESLFVDDEVEISIRDELLHQSIAELKPDYRMLIKMYYVEELPYKEISSSLSISEPAVGQKLYRARKKLLQIFKRKWVNKSE